MNEHSYTIPHEGIVASPARAAAAVFLVLMAKGAALPIIAVSTAHDADADVVIVIYKGDRILRTTSGATPG